MGCHTWFYKKKRDVSDEEVRRDIIKNLEDEIASLENETLDKTDKMYLRYIEMVLRGIKKGKIGSRKSFGSLWENQNEDELYHEGAIYTGVNYHDLFRVGGYLEDKLVSLEETKDFIEKNNIEDVRWTDLEKFWFENPDGLIEFI